MLLHIDAASQTPVFRQICEQVSRLVDEGALEVGERLPASRALADRLGVNRSTVVRAYQELWALGYLESRPGSYSTIRARLRPPGAGAPAGPATIDWERACSPGARQAHRAFWEARRALPTVDAGRAINFAGLAADRALCPVSDLRRAVRAVLLEPGRSLLDYGDPAGYRPLRETIARRMQVHAVHVGADEVVVTNGAQHALELVTRTLGAPGAAVLVESPAYAAALPLFRLLGVRLVPVPMRADGLDLDVVEGLLAGERPAFLYTVPNFHNPTGVTTSQAHRERLLRLCETHRVPLVEDGFEEEMKYFGRAVLPIKSMDTSGVVIYLGTFSKVVFPGLRVGWIAADRACVERLVAVNRFCSLSGSILVHAAVDRFCSAGNYEAHLRRVHAAYRRRMSVMLGALRRHLPAAGISWTQPAGGYTLWVTLETCPAAEEPRVVEALARAGVLVAAGRLFFPEPPAQAHFRLSIANLTELEIEEGCRRLGAALARIVVT